MSQETTQFPLDMNTEVATRSQQPQRQSAESTMEMEAQINERQRLEDSVSDMDRNPIAHEKRQRDLNYQRQMETLPQPESAPLLEVETTPGLDRLESLQQELDAAKAEATRWKKEFGRREGTVGQMKSELQQLKAQVMQIQPAINVQQITGREPGEAITAQDAVNLLMSQSQAFGTAMTRLREELLAQGTNQQEGGLPLDMEAELVEAHPWLTDLPRPNKLRAMHDILASSGVSITPPQPGIAPAANRQSATALESGRAQVRQAAFIEPSNRGSTAERNAIAPERQAFQEKVNKLKEALSRPGGSDEAAKVLAALGAGPVDETQAGYLNRR